MCRWWLRIWSQLCQWFWTHFKIHMLVCAGLLSMPSANCPLIWALTCSKTTTSKFFLPSLMPWMISNLLAYRWVISFWMDGILLVLIPVAFLDFLLLAALTHEIHVCPPAGPCVWFFAHFWQVVANSEASSHCTFLISVWSPCYISLVVTTSFNVLLGGVSHYLR